MAQVCARKVGSTDPIATTLTVNQTPIDLTTATTVTVHIAKGAAPGLTATAVIATPRTSGVVTAAIPAGANTTPGAYPLDWHIAWADGSTTKAPDPGTDTFLVDVD